MKVSFRRFATAFLLTVAVSCGLGSTVSAQDPFSRLSKSLSKQANKFGSFNPDSVNMVVPEFKYDKRRQGVTGKWLGYEAGAFKHQGGLNLQTGHLGVVQAGPVTLPYQLKTNSFFDKNGIRTNQHMHLPGVPKVGAVASQSVQRLRNGIRVSQDSGLAPFPNVRLGDSHTIGTNGYKHYHHLNTPSGRFTGGIHFKTGQHGGVRLRTHYNRR